LFSLNSKFSERSLGNLSAMKKLVIYSSMTLTCFILDEFLQHFRSFAFADTYEKIS